MTAKLTLGIDGFFFACCFAGTCCFAIVNDAFFIGPPWTFCLCRLFDRQSVLQSGDPAGRLLNEYEGLERLNI